MNRIANTFLASCIALGAASAMAQAGGGGGSGGGGGPGLNSPDSGAMQQKPTTGGTGPTNPNGTMTAPSAAQGNASSEGNLSGRAKASGGTMKSERKSDKRGAAGNTQGTGQAQTPSPQ